MGVNLVTMRRMVRDRLGVPIGDSFFSDSVLDTNINLAIAAFDSEMRWPWNEKLVDVTLPGGTASIKLPADWAALRAVTYKRNTLQSLPLYDLARIEKSSGSPCWYAVEDGTLRIAPSQPTDATLTLLYYREPLLMVDDGDVTRCPTQHVNALIAKACQFCAIREGERTEASDHLGEYAMSVQRAKKDAHRNMTRGVGRRIRPGAFL